MNANEVKKDLYKSKNMAKFSHYVSGNMYYKVELADGTYQFPISTIEPKEKYVEIIGDDDDWDKINGFVLHDLDDCYQSGPYSIEILELSSDLGTTTFETEMKGSDLNRWISKAIDKGEFIKIV